MLLSSAMIGFAIAFICLVISMVHYYDSTMAPTYSSIGGINSSIEEYQTQRKKLSIFFLIYSIGIVSAIFWSIEFPHIITTIITNLLFFVFPLLFFKNDIKQNLSDVRAEILKGGWGNTVRKILYNKRSKTPYIGILGVVLLIFEVAYFSIISPLIGGDMSKLANLIAVHNAIAGIYMLYLGFRERN